MKNIESKTIHSKRRNHKNSPVILRKTDWRALMKHDRSTGRLDLKNKTIIKDPQSVKRLMDANMILADGTLTPEAKKKVRPAYKAII